MEGDMLLEFCFAQMLRRKKKHRCYAERSVYHLRKQIRVTSARKMQHSAYFAQMLRRKKSTDVMQKDLCNICESESVYHLREKCSKWKQLSIGIPSHLDDLQRIMVTD